MLHIAALDGAEEPGEVEQEAGWVVRASAGAACPAEWNVLVEAIRTRELDKIESNE